MKKTGSVRVLVEIRHVYGADKTAYNNPTARAIKDRLGKIGKYEVAVWQGRVRIGQNTYPLPNICDLSEQAFAAHGVMNPYEFQLSNRKVEDLEEAEV